MARERALRGMSVAKISALANMSHVTWGRIEDGERVQPAKLAAVDRVFRWETGTCVAILSGEDPPLPDARIIEIMRSTVFTDEEKGWLIEALPPRKGDPSEQQENTG